MLEAPLTEIPQLRFEIGASMIPARRALHRLVLPERTVEQYLSCLRRSRSQQVQDHRVGGGELGVDSEFPGDRRVVDVPQLDVTFLEDHPVADGVDPTPSGTAHELGQLTAGQ